MEENKSKIVEKKELKEEIKTAKKENKYKNFIINNAIYFILLLIFIGLVIKQPDFLSLKNFENILVQSSTRIIFAIGVGAIILAKGTDLSLGRQVGLAAVISASLIQNPGYQYKLYPNLPELPVIVPILAAMVACMVFSTISGVVIAKFKVDPFIATLGMMIIVYGITSIYFDRPPLGASPIGSLNPKFTNLANGAINLGPIKLPYLILIALLVTVFMWVIWNKTRFGKSIYAVGGNIDAARVSGINTSRVLIAVFALSGLLYGLGGALEAARVGSATNNTGNFYEMDAIAACILGGLSFNGGIGKISGIVTGVLIFQVIAYGLNFVSVTPYIQNIIKGLIIIIAVAIDSRKNAQRV